MLPFGWAGLNASPSARVPGGRRRRLKRGSRWLICPQSRLSGVGGEDLEKLSTQTLVTQMRAPYDCGATLGGKLTEQKKEKV